MIYGITGHRFGKNFNSNDAIKVGAELKNLFVNNKPEKIISGLALGVDQIAALIALDLNIPFIGAVPFIGQQLPWKQNDKEGYLDLLKKAERVVIVSSGDYATWKLHKRNEWIVDNCDKLIAVYHKSKPKGGTFNCIEYAKKVNKEIIYVEY